MHIIHILKMSFHCMYVCGQCAVCSVKLFNIVHTFSVCFRFKVLVIAIAFSNLWTQVSRNVPKCLTLLNHLPVDIIYSKLSQKLKCKQENCTADIQLSLVRWIHWIVRTCSTSLIWPPVEQNSCNSWKIQQYRHFQGFDGSKLSLVSCTTTMLYTFFLGGGGGHIQIELWNHRTIEPENQCYVDAVIDKVELNAIVTRQNMINSICAVRWMIRACVQIVETGPKWFLCRKVYSMNEHHMQWFISFLACSHIRFQFVISVHLRTWTSISRYAL